MVVLRRVELERVGGRGAVPCRLIGTGKSDPFQPGVGREKEEGRLIEIFAPLLEVIMRRLFAAAGIQVNSEAA